jgi:3-phosphoshikimate 1-carboxyvinyltransferase
MIRSHGRLDFTAKASLYRHTTVPPDRRSNSRDRAFLNLAVAGLARVAQAGNRHARLFCVSKQKIRPARSVHGGIELPGDKSISHRYAMLAALAEGTSKLSHFATAADCHSTLDCMKALGAEVKVEKEVVRITGHGLCESERALDAGNSGTTMRLLAGILAGQPFASKLTGDASLKKRPMKRVVGPLRQMGAEIAAREDNFAPLEIRGGRLKAIHYEMPMASAQVKSAVLLAGLFADGATTVIEPARTRDHTELALEEFGGKIERHGRTITVHGKSGLKARQLDVPGDLSSAVFFIAAASLFPESTLLIHNVGLNPTRTAILDVLLAMGGNISTPQLRTSHGEVVGDLAVKGTLLKGGVIEGSTIPLVIDELPMLAALGPYTEEGIEIRNAEELRFKESDRIAVLAENLRRMGAQVEERPDGLRIAGRNAVNASAAKRAVPLHGAEIDPRGDHRIAMAFAVAALAAEGPTTIRDSDCAAVSFPTFYSELDRVAER